MSTAFHNKYRPRKFDQLIGHERAVTRLRGIVKSGKIPNALMFVGPTSCGKTTLARCFAAEVNEAFDKSIDKHPDYMEQNAGANGKVDNIRELLRVAQLNPQRGKRRFIVIDEAQKLTEEAKSALLKTLEEPPSKTTFVLCSMEAEKFSSSHAGKALANRCSPFVLEALTKDNIIRHLTRVAKKEEMDYVNEKILSEIANNSQGEMRTAANLLEALQQYASATEGKITSEDIDEVIASVSSKDDEVALRILLAIYAKKFTAVQKAVLDAQDPFGLINKLLWMNGFMLSVKVLNGEKHQKVWWSKPNQELKKKAQGLIENNFLNPKQELQTYAMTQVHLVRMRQQAMSFLVPEVNLIGALAYELILELKRLEPRKE
jgi:DNA polymerase III subunit gamma/tau